MQYWSRKNFNGNSVIDQLITGSPRGRNSSIVHTLRKQRTGHSEWNWSDQIKSHPGKIDISVLHTCSHALLYCICEAFESITRLQLKKTHHRPIFVAPLRSFSPKDKNNSKPWAPSGWEIKLAAAHGRPWDVFEVSNIFLCELMPEVHPGSDSQLHSSEKQRVGFCKCNYSQGS